jgi:PAS domain S-box-containing protein
MSDHKLLELQQTAEKALQSQNFLEGAALLSKAVELCSDEAARLKSAYAKLQERFESVNRELASKVEQLSGVSRFLTNILQNISDAIVFVDLNGTIAIANEAAQKIVQKKGEALLFKRYWDLFPDEMLGFSLREALRYGISHQLLYKTLPQTGRELEISTSFLFEGPKSQHGLIILLRDITERQKMQQAAARSDRMKELGSMAAKVAHEIRNPLGGIRGFATLLHRDLSGLPHLQEMAGQVIEGTKSLERLVTTVLQYARPVQIVLQTADLGQFLKQLAKFVRIDPAFPPTVKLLLHVPNEPLLVPFDQEGLKSALLNLIFNGLQAMGQGGTLTLSVLQLDLTCQISIVDTGVGMNEEQLQSLFSPFFTTKSNGNGLGLVETQKIIQAHGGAIDVRSLPGRGTTFTLTLPLKR